MKRDFTLVHFDRFLSGDKLVKFEVAFWLEMTFCQIWLKSLISQSIERFGSPLMAESFQACFQIYPTYHTCAIITHGLYIFYLSLENNFYVLKEGFSEHYSELYISYFKGISVWVWSVTSGHKLSICNFNIKHPLSLLH